MSAAIGLVPAEHERDLAATLRDLFATQQHSQALRESFETPSGWSATVWKALAEEIGLCGLTVPEEFGGLGLGMCEGATVHLELGRALFPGPFLSTSLATTAILASGDPSAAERWLPRIAAGELVATVLLAPGDLTAEGTLHGSATFLPYGASADLILLPVASGGTVRWFAVEAPGDGLVVDDMDVLDLTRRQARVELRGVRAEPLTDGVTSIGDAVAQHLRLALAAEAVGGLQWCLETCVEYAKTRTQFGRPIGSFQAVAHACVQMLEAVQSGAATTRWAAVAHATGSPETVLAGHVAALRTGEAYRAQTEAAIHLLGGVGFTWEHDAHLYYRRARAALALSGGPSRLREQIAAAAGLGPLAPAEARGPGA
ncbi:MAG: acyl-CoA dehydrogenase family protein [Sporichthyaceae bacterium]